MLPIFYVFQSVIIKKWFVSIFLSIAILDSSIIQIFIYYLSIYESSCHCLATNSLRSVINVYITNIKIITISVIISLL